MRLKFVFLARTRTYGNVAGVESYSLAAAKDWEAARGAVDAITNGSQRTAALVDIAINAAEDGHGHLALSWATAEVSPLSEATG